ncbi:MAG: hypothetical protein ABI585_15035 [Betaproteobacteria bacterium]
MKLLGVDIAPSPQRPGQVRLSGIVRYDDARGGPAEETFWFEVPAALEPYLTASGNPWLAMLLPVAVVSGEPLVLSRPVDASLLDNARDLLLTWRSWFPGDARISIEADVDTTPARHDGEARRTASFFSGGIDSFHTVLRPRAAPLDDLILALGSFDLAAADDASLERVRTRMQRAADGLGKPLVAVTTNQIRTRLVRTDPVRRSGLSMLAAIGLALERRYARFLVSASIDQHWKPARRDDALVAQHLSTPRTRFEIEGMSISRVEKTALVAACTAARDTLRVCFESGREDNCMACAKCIRTAIALEALGGLEHWPTFGGRSMTAARAARATVTIPIERYYWRELPSFCRERGREDLARAAEQVLARARRLDRFRPLVRWLRRFPAVAALTHRAEAIVQDVDPLSLPRR